MLLKLAISVLAICLVCKAFPCCQRNSKRCHVLFAVIVDCLGITCSQYLWCEAAAMQIILAGWPFGIIIAVCLCCYYWLVGDSVVMQIILAYYLHCWLLHITDTKVDNIGLLPLLPLLMCIWKCGNSENNNSRLPSALVHTAHQSTTVENISCLLLLLLLICKL